MPFVYLGKTQVLTNVVLHTARLNLVPVSHQDIADIFENFTAEITRYMMPAPAETESDTEAFVEAAVAGFERHSDLHLTIRSKNTDEFLGICGLHERLGPDELELGIWLKKAAHGNNYGLEAIRAVKEWAEQFLRYRQLIYPVDRRNIPSRRIAEALGGNVIAEDKKVSMGGQELDEVVYSISNPSQSGT